MSDVSTVAPRHLHLFLLLGIAAIIAFLCVPFLLVRQARSERARLVSCERQERLDCNPSIMWLLMK